ncbi:MAG: HNH endonuclease [Ignavibacteriae bacterium]|nr:HNH endonuclease [Ignavibacteriota bacterium]
MKDEIISYREMCDRENVQTLQRGMNFRLNSNYSVILMSQRKNAPYKDKIFDDGFTLGYEGHDIPKNEGIKNPKSIDQPRNTKTGKLTQNGLFAKSIENYKSKISSPELVRVYEKLFDGVWSEKGFFKLIDYKYQNDENKRKVFRFVLEEADFELTDEIIFNQKLKPRTRLIPSNIKKEVWKRDSGKCVICGSTDELHFDHDLPYSKGGTSISINNVRILCARHNLSKIR